MDAHRVFIIGDSLFAEGLSQLLGKYAEICIVGMSVSAEDAIGANRQAMPDVFILAGAEGEHNPNLTRLFAILPEIPIICAGLDTNMLQVFAKQQVQARTADLISTITSLPKRS